MAFENSNFSKTYRAASAIAQYAPVSLVGAVNAASAIDETVIPTASAISPYLGVARASAAVGAAVTVDLMPGFVKCVAAASLGQGAWVGVQPGSYALIPVAAASIGAKALGQAETSAAAG